MVVSGSPKRWWVAYNPPEGKDYKWYILPIGGWTMPPTSHLLGEPETTIEPLHEFQLQENLMFADGFQIHVSHSLNADGWNMMLLFFWGPAYFQRQIC